MIELGIAAAQRKTFEKRISLKCFNGAKLLTPPQEHRSLHRGDDKFGNFLAFELRWQLARLYRRLQALGDRSSNFRENLGQGTANIFTVLVQLGGHIPVEATVLCAGDFEESSMSNDIIVQPFAIYAPMHNTKKMVSTKVHIRPQVDSTGKSS